MRVMGTTTTNAMIIMASSIALLSCSRTSVGNPSYPAGAGDSAVVDSSPGFVPTPTPTPTPIVVNVTPYNLTLTWAANPEKLVNQVGGGYIVYYYTTSGQSLLTAPNVVVPYVAGPTAPTTTTLFGLTTHAPFHIYFKVVAFSAQTTLAGPTAQSLPSAQFAQLVP